jgi:hypothetical protein
VDPQDWDVAYVAYGGEGGTRGSLRVTTDKGEGWSEFDGPGASAAFTAPLTGAVLDPGNSKVLYVASSVGVFKLDAGSGALKDATWTPLLDGLPPGVDITGLAVNADRRKLVIGTLGYGAWTYDLGASQCKQVALSVRDNVFDDGATPSPFAVPDPEHPVVDPTRTAPSGGGAFYVAQQDPAAELYWWTSPDIRIHRPDPQRPQNAVHFPDGVSIESCPTDVSDCAPGTNIDSQPGRHETDLVYVQVTNRGVRAAHHVRVKAMWADATTSTPDLPSNFWSGVFPSSGDCTAPDPASGWHPFREQCVELPDIPPDASRVATFTWDVPVDAPDHACVLAMAECPDDPIPARAANALVTHDVVPATAQVGQRNLHPVDSAPGAGTLLAADSLAVGNPGSNPAPVDLYISRAGVPDRVRIGLLLPADSTLVLKGITRLAGALTGAELDRARRMHADSSAVYALTGGPASVRGLHVPPRSHRTIGLVFDTGHAVPAGRSVRVSLLEKQGTTILGGSVYVLRVRKP